MVRAAGAALKCPGNAHHQHRRTPGPGTPDWPPRFFQRESAYHSTVDRATPQLSQAELEVHGTLGPTMAKIMGVPPTASWPLEGVPVPSPIDPVGARSCDACTTSLKMKGAI